MICPKCNIWLPDTAKFCSQCGMPRSGFRADGTGIPIPTAAEVRPSVPSTAAAQPSIPSLSPQIAQASGLRPGERAVQMWRAGQVERSTDPEESDSSVSVILLATDQRLIVLREKGLMNKTYKPHGAFEYREVASYDLTSMLRIKGLSIYTQGKWMRSRTDFNNLCEVDPVTLKAVAPFPVEQTRALLDGLMGRK
ncbi:MAG: zinc ribbon domain-containing protein [Methanomassiliicoccus sp.]|nr:zinc ribbon domain-containing protein [Methanomassiliicoccus sp.]